MHQVTRALLALSIAAAPAAFVACQSDSTSPDGSGGSGGSGGSTTTTTTSNTGGNGTGGNATGGNGTGGNGTGGSGTGGQGQGGGTQADHLVISELAVAPNEGEFVEIYNPTAASVDLTDYYLSDNSAYVGIQLGDPWNPVTSNNLPTDFLARFPAGTTIPAGGAIAIATQAGFEATYGKCADFILAAADVPCAAGSAKAMLAPTNGGIGEQVSLSNDREMVILFHWTGDTNDLIEDVDYVTWGAAFEDPTRVDKTGIGTYQPDTPRANQKPAPAAGAGQSIERCAPAAENGEKASGGNGISGHDETSESLDVTFVVQAAPTPGDKNGCL